MVAISPMLNSTELYQDEGVSTFINFLHAIWKAKSGDKELQVLFSDLNLDVNIHPLALFGLLMSRKPLQVHQSETLKKILEIGAE
jgi:hypothetical protein